jgi:hypothetical protein
MSVRYARVLLFAILASAGSARAQPSSDKARCTDAYVQGQHLMRSTHLLDAQAALLLCARDPCPTALRPECAQWLAQVQRALPSVVVAAKSASGDDVRDGRVLLDGQPFIASLDGTAKDIDPGDHVFRFEGTGQPAVEQRVLVREGEKARTVTFHLAAPPASNAVNVPPGPVPPTPIPPAPVPLAPVPLAPVPPEAPPAPNRWPVYVLGAVGLVASASFAYFGVSGLSLYNQCHGHCSSSQVNAGNVDWTAADVSLGVALVSLGLGTYLYLRPERPAPGASSSMLVLGGRFD